MLIAHSLNPPESAKNDRHVLKGDIFGNNNSWIVFPTKYATSSEKLGEEN